MMEMAVPVGVKKLTLSEDDGFLDQATLESLASKNPDLSSLDFFSEFDDEQPGVDWSRISLPKLQSLDLTYCQLSSINFTAANTPSLQRLVISAAGRSLNSFKVELPDLRLFGCDDTWIGRVDGGDFGSSMSACPKLETISMRKVWGISDKKQKLHLPECTNMCLDSMELHHLEIYAPKLVDLDLSGNEDLKYVRLKPEQGPAVKIRLIRTQLNKASLEHLQQHPRVGKSRMKSK